MQKGYKAGPYPSGKQAGIPNRTFGCCRFVYNHLLAERKRACKDNDISLSCSDTSKLQTVLKRDKEHL